MNSDFIASLKFTFILFIIGIFWGIFIVIILNFIGSKYSFWIAFSWWIKKHQYLLMAIFFLIFSFLAWWNFLV